MLIPDLKINVTYEAMGLFFIERVDGTILKFAGSREEARTLANAIHRADAKNQMHGGR